MEPIEEVLRYPTRRENWVATVLVGGALTLLSFLIVPGILVTGYVLAVIRGRVADGAAPPAWGDWGELFVEGLKAWVVWFVYGIVPALVGLTLFGSAIAAMATGSDVGVALGLLGLGLGSLFWLALALVFFYPLPASLAALAVSGRLGAAFDVETIRAVVTTRAYAVPWLWSLAILVVAGAIGGAVNAVPLIGWVVGALFLFYVDVVLAVVWAAGWADGLDAAGRGVAEAGEAAPA